MSKECVDNAALYMRSATAGPADPCVEQREQLARMAESLGMEIVGEYSDAGRSGSSTRNRPQFQKMLNDAKAGLFKHLFVRDVSRLMRGYRVFELIAELQDYGVKIHFADGLEVEQVMAMADFFTNTKS